MRFVAFIVLILSTLPAESWGQGSAAPIEVLIERGRQHLGTMRGEFETLLRQSMKLFAGDRKFQDEARLRLAKELEAWVGMFPKVFAETFAKTSQPNARRRLAEVMAASKDPAMGDALLELLPKVKNPKKRTLILRTLGSLGNPRAIPVLLSILESSENADEKGAALVALARLKAEPAEKLAIEYLTHENPALRIKALRALPLVMKNPHRCVRHITARVKGDEVPAVRFAALRALAFFPGDMDGLHCLHDAVSGDDESERVAALDALERVAQKSLSKHPLRKGLKATTSMITKERIAKLMLRFGDSQGVKLLVAKQRETADRKPRNSFLQQGVGDSYRNLGAWSEAIDYYQRALATLGRGGDPKGLYLRMARCYAQMGKFADAKKSLKRAKYKDFSVLAEDDDFAKMAQSPKYKALFQRR